MTTPEKTVTYYSLRIIGEIVPQLAYFESEKEAAEYGMRLMNQERFPTSWKHGYEVVRVEVTKV